VPKRLPFDCDAAFDRLRDAAFDRLRDAAFDRLREAALDRLRDAVLFRADAEVLLRALPLVRLVLLLRLLELAADFVVVAMNPSMEWGTQCGYPNQPPQSPGP
jgi:hypothetical protein